MISRRAFGLMRSTPTLMGGVVPSNVDSLLTMAGMVGGVLAKTGMVATVGGMATVGVLAKAAMVATVGVLAIAGMVASGGVLAMAGMLVVGSIVTLSSDGMAP